VINSQVAHGEDGAPIGWTGFDYDTIEDRLFNYRPESDLSEFSQDDIDRALKVLTTLLEWVWQSGMKNGNGIQIRAIIMCWIFLKHVRPLQEAELARGFGKKKQSLGRWVENFKKAFPRIKVPHFR
jgi:hypothetical protein